MATDVAEIVLLVVGIYAALGFLFGIGFAARGAGVIDPLAKGGPWAFRVLIVPGAAALWPLLLTRWVAAARTRP